MNKGQDKGHKGQMSDREVMKMALEALKTADKKIISGGIESDARLQMKNAIAVLRQALDHVPDTMKMLEPDMGIDRGAWDEVPDATKWVDELRGGDETEQEPFCYHDGRNIVRKEFADHSDVFPLYTTPQPAVQGEPVAKWQQIETAPKTGRKVILFYLNRNKLPRTVMARWLTDEQAAETDADGVGLEGGWYECIDNWDDYTEVAIQEGEPSHWMSLPAPPIEAAHGIGEKK